MQEIKFDTGLIEASVNGIRSIFINPLDTGFAETLYGLAGKIDSIHNEKIKKSEEIGESDYAAIFELNRSEDCEMRAAVDEVFGEGFCADVFKGVRLMAAANGLTAVENFLFAVLDTMDESVTTNMSMRDKRIAKYTERYQKYKKHK